MPGPRLFTSTKLWLAVFAIFSIGCDRVERAVDVLLEDPSQTGQVAQDDPFADPFAEPTQPGFDEPVAPVAQQEPAKRGAIPFQIFDKGLNVVRTTVLLPGDWRGYQDISTSSQTGETQRYVLDYYGPQGELIRATGAANYYGPMGQSFGKMWPQRIKQAMQGVGESVKLGQRRETELIRRLPNINKVLGNANKEAFEVPFTATRDGQPLEGIAYVLHVPFSGDMGTFITNIVVASPDRFAATVDIGWEIGISEQINPEFVEVQNQISKRVMAKSARDHQARMRANQRSFDAHQARMRGQQATFDQANAAWLKNFRGDGGSGGSGSGYTGHDAVIDGIHETNTFADPSTGQNVRRSGQFQYNFTDGQGNFYGTNDANFNPAALQGDWQATAPLEP